MRMLQGEPAACPVSTLLANGTPLPAKYVDQPRCGEWQDFRGCHGKPELVLIYRNSGSDGLQLARLDSPSDFDKLYKPLADHWVLYDNSGANPALIEKSR